MQIHVDFHAGFAYTDGREIRDGFQNYDISSNIGASSSILKTTWGKCVLYLMTGSLMATGAIGMGNIAVRNHLFGKDFFEGHDDHFDGSQGNPTTFRPIEHDIFFVLFFE